MMPSSPLLKKRKKKSSVRLFLAMDTTINTTTPITRRSSGIFHNCCLNKTPIDYSIRNLILSNYNKINANANNITSDIEKSVIIRPLSLGTAKNTPFVNKQNHKARKIFLIPHPGRKAMKENKKLNSTTTNPQISLDTTKDYLGKVISRDTKRTKTSKEITKHSFKLKHNSAMLRRVTQNMIIKWKQSSKEKVMKEEKEKEAPEFNIDDSFQPCNYYNQVKSIMNSYFNQIEENLLLNNSNINRTGNNFVNVKYKELRKEVKTNEVCVKTIIGNLEKKRKDNDDFLRYKYNIKRPVSHRYNE